MAFSCSSFVVLFDSPPCAQAAAMLADNKEQFKRTVRQTFEGRPMVVAGKRYDFPKFT